MDTIIIVLISAIGVFIMSTASSKNRGISTFIFVVGVSLWIIIGQLISSESTIGILNQSNIVGPTHTEDGKPITKPIPAQTTFVESTDPNQGD